jgi:hypothetical protein
MPSPVLNCTALLSCWATSTGAAQVKAGLSLPLERGQQHVVQVGARQRGIRRAIAGLGPLAKGSTPSKRASVPPRTCNSAGKAAAARKADSKPKSHKTRVAFGPELDASPHRRKRGDLLKYLYAVPRADAGQRRRQASDPRADHGNAANRVPTRLFQAPDRLGFEAQVRRLALAARGRRGRC